MEESSYVSELNSKVLSNLPKRVYVYDCTLRDGEQTPGVVFTEEEKVLIAEALEGAGVDCIEAGFPTNSSGEEHAVARVAALGLKSKVSCLSRCLPGDIEASIRCEPDLVHLFISTSDIHLQHQIKKSREEVYGMAVESVKSVVDRGFECLFSAMDASRSNLDYLKKVYAGVVNAGATTINVPETVNSLCPEAMKYLVGQLKGIGARIDVHCHNDLGMALANTLAAIEAGAEEAQVTVNGLGERAGNTSLEQLAVILELVYGVKTGIKLEKLTELSNLMAKYSGIEPYPLQPIIGRNAFAHESGIHVQGILERAKTFEAFAPELVGQRRRLVLGKHAGKHGVDATLKSMGYSGYSSSELGAISRRVKELAEKQKKVFDEDIRAIVDSALGKGQDEGPIKLEEIEIMTGNKVKPRAKVSLRVNGKLIEACGNGVGPVDAAISTIESAIKGFANIRLVKYELAAITGGTDSLSDCKVTIKDTMGEDYVGHAVHEDIVQASIKAIINAMNSAMRRRGGR